MVESKGWNWKMVQGDNAKYWLEPSMESYYVLNRWKSEGKKDVLDLGCGLGRHTILSAENGFNTKAFDISENAVERAKEYCQKEKLNVEFKIGDMLELPYEDESFDGVLCVNVISHTDTEGMKKVVSELKRVLKKGGECYMTLGSKDTWGFKQEDWPLVDPNTRIRMDEGPEKGIPHFYADYDLIKELFKDFKIEKVYQKEEFEERNGKVNSSYHYHLIVRK